MLGIGQRRQIDIVALLRPQQRGQRARRRLEQRREVDVIGAKAHAVFAQGGARSLIEILHLGGDLGALQHAERLDQLEGDAAGDAADILGLRQLEQRPEQLFQMGFQPEFQPSLHRLARRAGQPVISNDAQPRLHRVVGRHQLGHGVAGPADGAIRGQHKLFVRRSSELAGARFDLAGQRLERCSLQRLGFGARLGGIRNECKTVEPADGVALDDHFAGLSNFRIQHRIFPQAAHQYTGTTINETLCKAFVERI